MINLQDMARKVTVGYGRERQIARDTEKSIPEPEVRLLLIVLSGFSRMAQFQMTLTFYIVVTIRHVAIRTIFSLEPTMTTSLIGIVKIAEAGN